MKTELMGVWVYCYNESYPGCFMIDPTNVAPNRPYKIGDIYNTFPEGMVLHERYKKIMHRNIVSLGID